MKFNLVNAVWALLMSLLIAAIVGHEFGSAAAWVSMAVTFGVPLIVPMLTNGPLGGMKGMAFMGISKEVWSSRVEANLFKNNEFLLKSTDDSENVNYKTVHIPQSGAVPNVVKNRVKGGDRVNPNQRTDQEVTYNIDEWTTDPFIIVDAEKKELSYSKIDSELMEQQMQINEVVADNMIINWAPTGTALLTDGVTVNANILRSTGVTNNDTTNIQSSPAYTPNGTGNRLNFTIYDLRQAKKFLGKQKVPAIGRHILISEDACDQLINDLIATKFRQDTMNVFDTKEGTITRLLGFDVHVRSTSVVYDNSATPVVKPYGAAGAATDNEAILCWYEGYVSRAIGDIHVYETPDSATDYGDIYSVLVRAGGAKRRKTEVGVVAIVQAASV